VGQLSLELSLLDVIEQNLPVAGRHQQATIGTEAKRVRSGIFAKGAVDHWAARDIREQALANEQFYTDADALWA
jgi:hypothetical protein